jgi:hypothetical protein
MNETLPIRCRLCDPGTSPGRYYLIPGTCSTCQKAGRMMVDATIDKSKARTTAEGLRDGTDETRDR